MAKVRFQSVDDYLAAQPEPTQRILLRLRSTIRKAVSDAEESISYHMPTYKLAGDVLLYFAGWKQHYSLYPATPGVTAAFKAELAGYKVEKGTIRFPLTEPVPVKLIAAIAKLRAQEVKQRADVEARPKNRTKRPNSRSK
jgi:uncharacterized protein YdhG (YjbR/CyaY superfamily)